MKKERKVQNRKEKEAARGKYFYAKTNEFSTANNPLPVKFTDKIICGDSLTVLKELPDNCIDLIFTSPPYNFGLDYEDSEDAFPWKSYFKCLFDIFEECIRVVKHSGRIIVNIQPLYSDYIPTHHIISQYFMRKNLYGKLKSCGKKTTITVNIPHGAAGKAHQALISNTAGNF